MRVAAVVCLMSSGLFVGGASGAVALAEPDSSGDAAGTGTAGRTSADAGGLPRRTAPRGVGTTTGAGSGSPGQRPAASPAGTAESPVPPAVPGESDPSKLPETAADAGGTQPGDTSGEQHADPPAADAGAKGDVKEDEDVKADDDVKEDEDDDECGWWPLPPESVSSAPNGGDGYGGGAPAAVLSPTDRPGVPPGMEIPPPPELLPESLVVPDPGDPLLGLVAPPALSMPVLALPPVVPGVGGGGDGAGPRAPAPENTARPAAPPRTPAAEPPATPRTDAVLPASYRTGYGEYLRTAGMPQILAVALPGATGIMLLTGVGGLIGYRQARAGHAIRAGGSARFSS